MDGGQGITVTGDTDDDYIRILKDIEEAICKIAPNSTVSVQVSYETRRKRTYL